MTEFTELELNKDVESMTEAEAKETLSDFMDAHTDNQAAYDAKAGEVEEVESEYQEKIETLEEKVSEFKERRAQEAAEYVKMPAEILAARFSFDELDQIIEEAEGSEEFSEDEPEDDEDDGRLTEFVERDQKSKKSEKTETKFNRSTEELLAEQGLPIGGK